MKGRLVLPDRPSSRREVMLGRSLAMFMHPYATWRVRPTRRALLVFGYFMFSYLTALTILSVAVE